MLNEAANTVTSRNVHEVFLVGPTVQPELQRKASVSVSCHLNWLLFHGTQVPMKDCLCNSSISTENGASSSHSHSSVSARVVSLHETACVCISSHTPTCVGPRATQMLHKSLLRSFSWLDLQPATLRHRGPIVCSQSE